MNDQELENFFKSKAQSATSNLPKPVIADKTARIASPDRLMQIAQIAKDKQDFLAGAVGEYEREQERNKDTWAYKAADSIGLDKDLTNLVASSVSGISNVVGNIASAFPNIGAGIIQDSVSEEDKALFNKYTEGLATPEEVKYLNTPKSFMSEGARARAMARGIPLPADSTVLSQLKKAEGYRNVAKKIDTTMDISSIVSQENRNRFNSDLKENFQGEWDKVTSGYDQIKNGNKIEGTSKAIEGIYNLLVNAGSAVLDNKQATLEYLAENAPQAALGALKIPGAILLATSNVGYAADEYRKGIQKYAENNNGALPSEEKRSEMLRDSAGLALAEQLGEMAQLGKFITKPTRAVSPTLKTSLLNTIKSIAGAGVTEGITEGYQTKTEGDINGTDVSAADIYVGATIGAVSGGVIGGGGHVVGELTNTTEAHQRFRDQIKADAEFHKGVVASKDITPYTDPNSETYSLERAVNALHAMSKDSKATPEEKTNYSKQATDIVKGLNEKKNSLEEAVYPVSEKEVADAKNQLIELARQKETVDPTDTESLTFINEAISSYESLIANSDPAVQKHNLKELKEVSKQLKAAEISVGELYKTSNTTAEDFNADEVITQATNVDTTDAVSTKAAVERVINLSMSVPESITDDQLTELSTSPAFSNESPARSYMSAVSTARESANVVDKLSKFSREILYGSSQESSRNIVGIKQFRQRIGEALSRSDVSGADTHIAEFGRAVASHVSKSEAANRAEAIGGGSQIYKNKDGTWEVSKTKLGKTEAKAKSAVSINSEIASSIAAEAKAMQDAQLEFKAAATLKSDGEANVAQPQQSQKENQVESGTPTSESTKELGSTEDQGAGINDEGNKSTTSEKTSVDSASSPESTANPNNISIKENVEDKARTEEVPSVKGKKEPKKKLKGILSVYENTEINTKDENGNELTKAALYQKINLIAAYTFQAATSVKDKSKQPLAITKDFLTKLRNGSVSVTDFLQGERITDKQKKLFNTFLDAANHWLPMIKENLIQGNFNTKTGKVNNFTPGYYKDAVQFLIFKDEQDKADLDENVKTAIALGVFTWINENTGSPDRISMDYAKSIFGLASHDYMSYELYETLNGKGNREEYVSNTIGKKIVQALGIKATEDAPADLIPRLEASLGAHGLKLLDDMGYINRVGITNKVISNGLINPEKSVATSKALNESSILNESGLQMFVALKKNEDGTFEEGVEAIKQDSKETSGILNKIFGVEGSVIYPTTKPVIISEDTITLNSDNPVPKSLIERQQIENNSPYFIHQGLWHVFSNLSDYTRMYIAGAKDVTKGEVDMHKTERLSQEAKNASLQRNIDSAIDFINSHEESENGLDTPLFLNREAWVQQRAGIATTVMNVQTDKVARALMSKESWVAEVSSEDLDMMDNFKLRVLEGMGFKTDNHIDSVSLQSFDTVFKNSEKGIAAINAIFYGEDVTAQIEQDLIDAVIAGKENMASLMAIYAMAEYSRAKVAAEGKPFTFKTQLTSEVDAKTSGGMLAHITLGAAHTPEQLVEFINQGGFYEEGSATHFSEYKALEGTMDLYESTTDVVVDHVVERVENTLGMDGKKDAEFALWFNTINSFIGTLRDEDTNSVTKEGRNFIKTPLTAMLFGSSVKNTVAGMKEDLVNLIYKESAKISDEASRVNYIKRVNTLIHIEDYFISTKLSKEELMELTFSPIQASLIGFAFSDTYGNSILEVMQDKFALFLHSAKVMTDATQTVFNIYNTIAKREEFNYKQELIKAGELDFYEDIFGNNIPRHDLNSKEKAVLKERLKPFTPIIHTAFSKESNQLEAGLPLLKDSRSFSNAPDYVGRAAFATPMKNGAMGVGLSPIIKTKVSMGVGSVVATTHSTDSHAAHHANVLDTNNYHDSKGAGLNNIIETAESLNKSVFRSMIAYSPMAETRDVWVRMLEALASLENKNYEAAFADLRRMIAKEDKGSISVRGFLLEKTKILFRDAHAADVVRLNALKQIKVVDHYVMEKGAYKTTQEDMDLIDKELSSLIGEKLPSAVLAYIEEVVDRVNTAKAGLALTAVTKSTESYEIEQSMEKVTLKPISKTQRGLLGLKEVSGTDREQAAITQENANKISKAGKAVTSIWGEVGTPDIAPHTELLQEFINNPVMDKTKVLQVLNKAINAQNSSENIKYFQVKLLSILNKTIPDGLVVKYVTPGTTMDNVLEASTDISRGWYVQKNTKNEIYILSADHKNSAITPEVLLHEITHSALAGIIENELINIKEDPKFTSEANKLVRELQDLRRVAEEYANANKLSHYTPAFKDVHEFVSWGMSNESIQRDVLAKIKFTSTTGDNKLVIGMKKFIETITQLLFGKTPKADNGMAVLIQNVSGLFYQSKYEGAQLEILLNQQVPKYEKYDVTDLFYALDSQNTNLSPSFKNHLSEMLDTLVTKLHIPFGSFKQSLMQEQVRTPLDTWLKAVTTGQAPFAVKARMGIEISEQEAFVVDQIQAAMDTVLSDKTIHARVATKELVKLYEEARANIKVADLRSNPDKAQKMYDFLFAVENGRNGNLDYLSRFVSLGLGHQAIHNALNFKTKEDLRNPIDQKTFADKLRVFFEKALSLFTGFKTHTFGGQKADAKLETLFQQLIDIEGNRKHALLARGNGGSIMNTLEDKFKEGITVVKDKVVDLAGSNAVRNNKSAIVKAAGTAVRLSSKDLVGELFSTINKMGTTQASGVAKVVGGIINNVVGPSEWSQTLLREAKKNETDRHDVISHTTNQVLSSFTNRGKDLTNDQKEAISKVGLRIGTFNLLDKFSMDQIHSMMTDRSKLDAEIDKSLIELDQFGLIKNYLLEQAQGLALYRAKGDIQVEAGLLMNVENIVDEVGSPRRTRMSDEQKAIATEILTPLIALYGLKFSSLYDLKQAAEVMAKENARTDNINGYEFALRLHKGLWEQAKEKAFSGSGNSKLMIYGHLPEVTNPRIELEFATKGDKTPIDKGFTEVSVLALDKDDPTLDNRVMYIRKDGGNKPIITGALAYNGKKMKGTPIHNGYMNQFTESGRENKILHDTVTANKISKVSAMYAPKPKNWDISKRDNKNLLVPVVNNKGEFANWRYVMKEDLKDTLLERNNDFSTLLGVLAGSLYDKENIQAQNAKVIDALHQDYEIDYDNNPNDFVFVGPSSDDPGLKELWQLLPAETKKSVHKTWKRKDGLYVRKTLLDITFGYRKLGLGTIWDMDSKDRNFVQESFKSSVENFIRVVSFMSGDNGLLTEAKVRRAQAAVNKGEDIWQEIVKEVKDIIVIKSGIVYLGNEFSNKTQLLIKGISAKEIFTSQVTGMSALKQWKDDTNKLSDLENQVKAGYLLQSEDETLRMMRLLEDSLEKNPLKPLIDAGLRPTIVEDVSDGNDPYSYKSYLVRKVEGKLAKLNPTLVAAGKNIAITHDTKLYKALNSLTQDSDFIARYILYTNLTTRAKNPLSTMDAIHEVSESFINYDIPMQKGLQYTDDMGITMFTKYFLNIQRVLLKMGNDNPLRVLLTVSMQNYLGNLPFVTEGSFVAHLGNNPLNWGALQLPGTVDELMTVSAAGTLLK